ncbi:zinc finger HIT domain-containing protein 1-like isoform X2 [Clavelina lepadiformis]|uniref:zinc finger HIT domain-containing protein 1-like isoform X2 n=1 Tax=Clavelina lepadiformis TaxID=159417 RepID=UPI004040F880
MTSTSRRESSRLQEINSRRILDTATRQRRLHRQLEALEKDNFQEDPLENIQETPKTKRPKFGIPSDQELENEAQHTQPSKKKKRTRGDHFKQRFRKTFAAVLEEQRQTLGDSEGPSYFHAVVPSSRFPGRHFCAVCGFFSSYTCVSCGARYCSVRCLGTHQDTRCLKWTV